MWSVEGEENGQRNDRAGRNQRHREIALAPGDALLILGGAAGGGAGGTGRIEAAIANAGSITLAGSFATGQFGTQGDGQGGTRPI